MSDTRIDILHPLPLEKWSLLADTLKRDWPRFAYYHYWIKNVIQWKKRDRNVEIAIYCPEGKHDSGVFLGISSHAIYYLHAFAFEESRSLLYKCLTSTNLIDWSRMLCFASVHECYSDTIKNVIDHLNKKVGIKVVKEYPTNFYFKTKESCRTFDVDVPDDMELKLVGESDVQLIHDEWPIDSVKKNPKLSLRYISNLQKFGKGLGLFTKKESKLVCWAMQIEWGCIGNLNTLSDYRRRGYAKIVTKALAKKIARDDDFDGIAFIELGNTPSIQMFESLGFQPIVPVNFIVMDRE